MYRKVEMKRKVSIYWVWRIEITIAISALPLQAGSLLEQAIQAVLDEQDNPQCFHRVAPQIAEILTSRY